MAAVSGVLRLRPVSLHTGRTRSALGLLARAGRVLSSNAPKPGANDNVDAAELISTQHFRLSPHAHPLNAKPERLTKAVCERRSRHAHRFASAFCNAPTRASKPRSPANSGGPAVKCFGRAHPFCHMPADA